MKIRNDFVTNSSSSSYILAQKGEISDPQKKAIADYVIKNMLGEIVLTPQSTEDEIQAYFDENYIEGEVEETFRRALAEGKSVRHGWIEFDGCEDDYGATVSAIWKAMEKADPEHFEVIDGDLSY